MPSIRFRGPQNPLSNLYLLDVSFQYDGKDWTSSEHAYQYAKLDHHGCLDFISLMRLQMSSPMEAMQYSHQLLPKHHVKASWDLKKTSVMAKILHLKLSVSSTFRLALFQHGDFKEDTAHPHWGARHGGENHLGLLLGQLRDEIYPHVIFIGDSIARELLNPPKDDSGEPPQVYHQANPISSSSLLPGCTSSTTQQSRDPSTISFSLVPATLSATSAINAVF